MFTEEQVNTTQPVSGPIVVAESPLTRRLWQLWMPHTAGLNLARNRRYTLSTYSGGTGAAPVGGSRAGLAWQTNLSAQTGITANTGSGDTLAGSDDGTILVVVTTKTTNVGDINDTYLYVVGCVENTNAIYANGFTVPGYSNRQTLNCVFKNTSTSSTIALSSFLQSGQTYVCVQTYRRNLQHRVWVNGRLRGSATVGNFALDDLSAYTQTFWSVGLNQGQHDVALAGCWRRALDDGEAQALSLNPWQLFEPVAYHLPFVGAAAAAGNRRRRFFIGAAA